MLELTQKISQFIQDNPDMYTKILMYEVSSLKIVFKVCLFTKLINDIFAETFKNFHFFK